MWKPSSVVAHHRKRATLVWFILLVGILCYTIWEVSIVIYQQENPSTSFNVSNERYSFPYVSVCLSDGAGCYDPDGSTDDCIESALEYSYAEYNEEVIGPSEAEYTNCVGFDLTQFEVLEGDREESDDPALIIMAWVASDDPAAETEYSESVFIILGSGTDNEETTTVPYSRHLISSNEAIYDISAVTIGKTRRTFLSKDSVTSHPPLTVSTTKYVIPDEQQLSYQADDTYVYDAAIGMLYLRISQGSFSLTEIDDIEPQLFGTLMGNIGGFWELLLLAWGLFFISSSQAHGEEAEATLEARDFTGSLKKACCCGNRGGGAGDFAPYKTHPAKPSAKGRSEEQDEQEHGFDAADNVEVEDGFE